MNILDIFFPKRCVGCGRIGSYICSDCRGTIAYIGRKELVCPTCGFFSVDGATHPRCRTSYGLDGLTSFVRYRGVVKKAIKAIKYRLIWDMAKEMVSLFPKTTLPGGILVPIPLHPSRLRYRGFNQSEILGKLLPFSMRTDILKRAKETVPQANLVRQERHKNMENAFRVSATPPSRIILFDDVYTSGATMKSAATVLKKHGVTFVWGLTIAR